MLILAWCCNTPSTIPLTPFLPGMGKELYLRDAVLLPALRQAQDRRRGCAPLHNPFSARLLVLGHTSL